MRILLAVDFDVEANILEGIIHAGHEIVDRVTGAAALIETVEQLRPDLVILQAGPETLTSMSLTACDRAGARTIAVVSDDFERRQAHELGVVDRVDARGGWSALQTVIENGHRRLAANSFSAAPHTGDPREVNEDQPPASDLRDATPARRPTRRESRERENQNRKHLERERRASARSDRRGGPRSGRTQKLVEATQPNGSLSTATPNSSAAPSSQRLGELIAVWGPHGAPGRTTIAIALAFSLASHGHDVILIDADSYGGAIAPTLGVSDEAPGFAAACRLAGAASFNAEELDRVASHLPTRTGRLRLLSGIANPGRWLELSRERVAGVLQVARAEAEFVIVDTGFNLEQDEELMSDVVSPRRNASTHTAIEHADQVIAVCEGTPVGVQRFLRARLALLDLVKHREQVTTVVNRVRRTMNGIDTESQLREVLRRFGGIEHALHLPADGRACDRALAESIPVIDAAPRSQLAKQLEVLAARVLKQLPSALDRVT